MSLKRHLVGGMMGYVDKEEELEKIQKITIELGDLDWEDRERILRLLFSKMNTGQSASDWREDEQEEEQQTEQMG
jgi:hypothetical protein